LRPQQAVLNLSMLKGNSRQLFFLFLIFVGIAALVVLQSVRISQVKNRDTIRKQDLAKVQVFLESYYAKNKSYPGANFQRELPKDPISLLNYFYAASTDRQKYHLLARIENTEDTKYRKGLEGNCGASCTYGVASPGANITEILK